MDEHIQLAIRLCETGNFQEAIKRCLEILKVYPNNIEALNCLGVAAFNIEKYDVSEICFRKIIELDPANRKVSDDLKATLSERKLLEKINSQQIAIDNVKTVCLILGPYRNLTSLIAGILFLHPTCQVLNHAGIRIYTKPALNFLYKYDLSKFNAFLKYAICISGGGQRGPFGGSITLEHSFDYENLKKSYEARFGNSLIKEKIECLIWKESLKNTWFIKQNNIDLGEIIEQNNKLKFLLPIRNPLDCAESNVHTKHMVFNPNLTLSSSFEEVLGSILKDFVWFFKLQRKFSDNFFHFFENHFDDDVLINLTTFLRIQTDTEWMKAALLNFNIKKKYDHDEQRIEFYNSLVGKYFKEYPEESEKLLLFS